MPRTFQRSAASSHAGYGLYKGRDQTLKQSSKQTVFENNRGHISALRVAKLSRRYFAKDRFPFSCLQDSIATDINSAAEAAEALRPIAGPFAALLFSLGIIGTGLLALPVLGGSAAYAMGEALKWPVGLERKAKQAKAFYTVLAVATMIGLTINFTRLDPIKALVWAAIINGITAAPVMCFMMLLASRSKVMGKFTLPLYLKILGWLVTSIMAVAAAGMLLTSGK
jgi:Mn2+/Fe2+ NRAMP family transporter